MDSTFILIPLLVVLVTFTYGVARALLRVWLDHRLKLALLEKYEKHPELFASADEVLSMVRTQQHQSRKRHRERQDYTVTGVLLALMGLGGIISGRIIGVGNLAVGIYIGGMICIVLGVLIALVGLLLRSLGKHVLEETSPTENA